MLRYDGLDQDDHGVWTTPSGDLVAWRKTQTRTCGP